MALSRCWWGVLVAFMLLTAGIFAAGTATLEAVTTSSASNGGTATLETYSESTQSSGITTEDKYPYKGIATLETYVEGGTAVLEEYTGESVCACVPNQYLEAESCLCLALAADGSAVMPTSEELGAAIAKASITDSKNPTTQADLCWTSGEYLNHKAYCQTLADSVFQSVFKSCMGSGGKPTTCAEMALNAAISTYYGTLLSYGGAYCSGNCDNQGFCEPAFTELTNMGGKLFDHCDCVYKCTGTDAGDGVVCSGLCPKDESKTGLAQECVISDSSKMCLCQPKPLEFYCANGEEDREGNDFEWKKEADPSSVMCIDNCPEDKYCLADNCVCYPNVKNETNQTKNETNLSTCASATAPACKANCPNPAKECKTSVLGLQTTGVSCDCFCPGAITGASHSDFPPDEIMVGNLKVVIDPSGNANGMVTLNIYDENGKLVQTITKPFGEFIDITDSSTGETRTLKFAKNGNNYPTALYVDYPPCPPGQIYNPETCKCEPKNDSCKADPTATQLTCTGKCEDSNKECRIIDAVVMPDVRAPAAPLINDIGPDTGIGDGSIGLPTEKKCACACPEKVCPPKQSINSKTCQCECNSLNKTICERKGGVFDDKTCECKQQINITKKCADTMRSEPAKSSIVYSVSSLPVVGGFFADLLSGILGPQTSVAAPSNSTPVCINNCPTGYTCNSVDCACEPIKQLQFCGEGNDAGVCALACKDSALECKLVGGACNCVKKEVEKTPLTCGSSGFDPQKNTCTMSGCPKCSKCVADTCSCPKVDSTCPKGYTWNWDFCDCYKDEEKTPVSCGYADYNPDTQICLSTGCPQCYECNAGACTCTPPNTNCKEGEKWDWSKCACVGAPESDVYLTCGKRTSSDPNDQCKDDCTAVYGAGYSCSNCQCVSSPESDLYFTCNGVLSSDSSMSCYNDCANNPDSNGVCKVEGASCRCEPKIDMAQCAIGSADPKLCTATCINQNKKEVACVMQNGACACPGETISTCYWNDAINGCTGSCPSSQSGTGGDGGDANTVCRQVEGEKRCDCLPPLPAAPPQAPPVPPILSISQTATGGTLNVCAPGSAKVFVSALGSTTVREVLLGSGSCGIMPYTCTGAGTGTFTATTPTGGSASIGYSCK